jgi:serine/threonine protein kinase
MIITIMSLQSLNHTKRKPEDLLDQTHQFEECSVKKIYQAQSVLLEKGSSSHIAELSTEESNPRYEKLEMVGKGYSAVVFKAYDSVRDCCVAIKTVVNAGKNDAKEAAAREALTLTQLAKNQTPHRLQWIDSYGPSIVTDFIPEKDIYAAYLAPNAPQGDLDFGEVVTIFKQSLEFLTSLRKQNIAHGDLKPENMIYERSSRYLTIVDCPLAATESKTQEISQTPDYRSPDGILKGSYGCSVDLWSLACVVYELLTKTPLFPLDLPASDEFSHLQMIADQIGLPTKEFLDSCKNSSIYYRFKPEVALIQKPLNGKPTRWDEYLRSVGQQKQIPALEMEQLINLLKGMLRYEGRWTPETLLLSPIFREDICFHLAAGLPSKGKILIHRISDVFACAMDDPMKPVLTIDLESPVTRTCYHLPKDPLDHYVVFDSLPGPHSVPELHVSLQDGDTLDLKQHITPR